ncbi:MAG: ribonuclease D [Woeseiaceae bacterium]|nr:ribonuclease D [Woeseiaceae bacterium]
MTHYSFVESVDRLPHDLVESDVIGVDTEFMREKTYFAQLCLVQVATTEDIHFADPLKGVDLAAFWDATMDKTWVLHSARQDIEVVYQTADRMPSRIFDTQVAAGLMGLAPQIGYANLARELFEIDMAKSHTRADWTKRPLAPGLLQYAAEDVEYLLPAFDVLSELLDRRGRLEWAEQDSASLLEPALYSIDPANAITRLKGARNLRGRARAAAERLAAWRETEALKRDRPRQWIARDPILMELATKRPRNRAELEKIDGIPPKLVQRAGRDLLAAVAASNGDSNNYKPPSAPDESQKNLLKDMQTIVAACASDLELAPETIASKKELSAVIISGNRDSRLFTGWRRELIGDELLKLL